MFFKKRPTINSKLIMGLGALVTTLGKFVGGKVGSGIVGFGLAHLLLGTLAKYRFR